MSLLTTMLGQDGGGGGSGDVNSGLLGQLGYYAADGTTISGTNALPAGTTADNNPTGAQVATAQYVLTELLLIVGSAQFSNYNYSADTGLVNALVATLSPAPVAYADGLQVIITPANDNTTTNPTIDVNGLGPLPILKVDGSPVAVGDIITTNDSILLYNDLLDAFLLQNPVITNSVSASPLTTKGDIFSFSTVDDRLPVAVGDGKILQVNSAEPCGLGYSTASYPVTAGAAGNIPTSDGTNFVSAAPAAVNGLTATTYLLIGA